MIQYLLQHRHSAFPREKILFAAILQRIFEPGSDRVCVRRFRACGFLTTKGLRSIIGIMPGLAGRTAPSFSTQQDTLPFPYGPCTHQDLVEEALFQRHRNLLTEIDIAFFNATTLFFEGESRAALGARGYNKNGHPERSQLGIGVVMPAAARFEGGISMFVFSGKGLGVAPRVWPISEPLTLKVTLV